MNVNFDGRVEYESDDYFYCMGEEYGFECAYPDCDCDLAWPDETENDPDADEEDTEH